MLRSNGLCFLLVLCLVVPEPSHSLDLFLPLRPLIAGVLGIFNFGGLTSAEEDDNSQEDLDGNLFLSRVLKDPNLRDSADRCEEEQNPECDPDTIYRTHDGTCNNLKYPTWGSVNDCLLRILPAAYDGESGMRTSVDGDPLPTPRDLSLNIFTYKNKPTPQVTLFFTVFGQVVAHDQALSTPPVGEDLARDPGIQCCPADKAEDKDCAAIEIRPDDPFYSKLNITCINFLRGLKCTSCKNTGKENIANLVSAALDINIVYGSSKDDADQLRTKDGTGRLKARYTKNGELLPVNTDPNLTFCPVMKTSSCFMAGDPRVNQHAYLASMQTILPREHNRMVKALKDINPHWDDEKLYQTGRRILGAKYQAIVFNEYLPVLLGTDYMDKYNLSVNNEGEGTHYDSSLRLGSWSEYSTGTFRAHSMIPANTGYRGKQFKDMYSNNYPILNGQMDQVLRGASRVPSQHYDRFEVPDVTDFLYKQPNENFGLDIVSVDVNRGRDHGLPPYIEVLNYCFSTNNAITEFDHLSVVMPQEHIELLKKNYKTASDIDLYVGMQMEDIMEGSVLPPTSACVVAGQLYFAKYGDRFYFEHINEVPSFTDAQRESLKKSTIGRMICDNTQIKTIQKNPFLFYSRNNPILPCRQHPEVDLSLWKSSE